MAIRDVVPFTFAPPAITALAAVLFVQFVVGVMTLKGAPQWVINPIVVAVAPVLLFALHWSKGWQSGAVAVLFYYILTFALLSVSGVPILQGLL